jgi:hypothetical protein
MPKPNKPPAENPFVTLDDEGNVTINTIDGDEGARRGDSVIYDVSDEANDQNITIAGSESGDNIRVFTGSGNDTINIGDGENDVDGGNLVFTGAGNDQVIIDGASPSHIDNIIELGAGDDYAELNLAEALQSTGYTMIKGQEGNDTVKIDIAGLEEIVGEGNIDAAIAQLQADFDAFKASNPPQSKVFNVLDSVEPSGEAVDHGGTLYLGSGIETLEFFDSLVVDASSSDGITS